MNINIKTPEEIIAMREGGKILASILTEVATLAVPGKTTLDLENRAQELFQKHNVIPTFQGYHGFPAALCTSVNDEVVHTIPSAKRSFKNGDLLSIDCGVTHKGLITDSAIAIVIGNPEDEEAREAAFLRKVCVRALWNGIKQVRPGTRFGDISHAIGKTVKDAGCSVVKELTGHGVGHTLHEDPCIPNYGKRNTGPALKPGMTFALEPIITMDGPKTRTLEDGWNIITQDGSLACQHEHTILVTETGYEVLTLRENEI
jgi:methionyl aminopeptidase